tara:strand:+ start:83 stop:286 length:204 start_codon:yes stop_codon:yes gene_type:complete
MTPREKDKVCIWSNMTREGIVNKIVVRQNKSWYVGGSPGTVRMAEVHWPDGGVEEVLLNELKVIERP